MPRRHRPQGQIFGSLEVTKLQIDKAEVSKTRINTVFDEETPYKECRI